MSSSLYVSFRAGLTGLFAATVIYLLWKINLRINSPTLPEKYGDLVMWAFGTVLWTIWFGIAQVILIAYDETSSSSIHGAEKGQNYFFPKQETLTNERK
jgi:small-conductance mechanosensitive channel